MKIRVPYFLIFLILLLPGCDKADRYSAIPRENFEALWHIIDEHYCFFEEKGVDWEVVRRKYERQLSDTMSRYELFDLLSDMLAELKDGHTNLVSPFNTARYWAWFEDYPRNFNADIQRNYLGTRYGIAGGMRYVKLPGTEIGYIYYGSFSSAVSETNLDEIFYFFRTCRGLIIDVRGNGGGALTNVERIASRFLSEPIRTGYIVHKTGPGHSDFSEPYPVDLRPSTHTRWRRPTVVLTNRHSYSATNDFINVMRRIDRVVILGDRTGGGGGMPFSSELPNGWQVRFSASPLLDADKRSIESGIDPDIRVDMTKADMDCGKDTMIEAAIRNIRGRTKDE